MVTKNQIKLIKSLHQKKHRKNEQLFIAEGIKVVKELLESELVVHHIYYTDEAQHEFSPSSATLVSKTDLEKMSALTTVPSCLGVFEIPQATQIDYTGLVVALDDVRDPGNLGTIIRLCDWFGIKHIICSAQTVDVFNPKVVQATMGSMARVQLTYGDLAELIQNGPSDNAIYGTFLGGKNIYQQDLATQGIIVMGNEANGISAPIEALVNQRITIPRFGDLQQTESLNVAMASAIVLSEFMRAR